MAITLGELPALLKGIRDKAATAAPAAAEEMGITYRKGVQKNLRRYTHGFGVFTDSPPGEPPAYMSGALSRSITDVLRVSSGTRATSVVAPHVIYARIQELGGITHIERAKWMTWETAGIRWYRKRVTIPPRPYMWPTTVQMIADGSLTKAASEAFMAWMWD